MQMRFDALVEAAFDVEVFDDGFDNPVAIFQLRQIVVEIANGHEGSKFRRHERGGLGFLCAFQSAVGDAIAHGGRCQR